MAFTVWQQEDTPLYPGMANFCAAEVQALFAGIGGTGVNYGLGATYSSVATWSIAQGEATAQGLPIHVAATTVTPASLPRGSDCRDSVVVSPAGVVSVIAGAPCGTSNWTAANGAAGSPAPVLPATPTNSVLIGEIYIAGGLTTLPAGSYTDKRVTPAQASWFGASLCESMPLSVYGHSFMQGVNAYGGATPNSEGPYAADFGDWPINQNGWQRTWPFRVARRLAMLDWSTGSVGCRNGAMPSKPIGYTTGQVIAGFNVDQTNGQHVFYNDAPQPSGTPDTQSLDLVNSRQWNPGHVAPSTPGGSGVSSSTTIAAMDRGVVMLECAANDALQWCLNALTSAQVDSPVVNGQAQNGYYATSARCNQVGTVSGTTLTIDPIKATLTGASAQLTTTTGGGPSALPYRGQMLALYHGATAGTVNLLTTVDFGGSTLDAGANYVTMSDTPTTSGAQSLWTIPTQGDGFLINPTSGTLVLPTAAGTGGVFQVWLGCNFTTISATASAATIQSALQTLVNLYFSGITVTVTGSGTFTVAFTNTGSGLPQSVGDLYFDFVGVLSTAVNGQSACGGASCSFAWIGSVYYATSMASWSGTKLASGSTLSITLNIPAWASGTWVVGNVVSVAGTNYVCIANVTSATSPGSDATHWTAIPSNCPIVQYQGSWYGTPAAAYTAPSNLSLAGVTSMIGGLAAWTRTLEAAARWFRCDTSGGAADRGSHYGLVKDPGGAFALGSTGAIGGGVTNTITLNGGDGIIAQGQQVYCSTDGGMLPTVAVYATRTSGGTATTNTVTLNSASIVAGSPSIEPGMTVSDVTNPGSLPAGTYVTNVSGMTITLSNPWTVSCGTDTMLFGGVVVVGIPTLIGGDPTLGTASWTLNLNAPIQRAIGTTPAPVFTFLPPGSSVRLNVPFSSGTASWTVNGKTYTPTPYASLYILQTPPLAAALGSLPPLGAQMGVGAGYMGTVWASGSGIQSNATYSSGNTVVCTAASALTLGAITPGQFFRDSGAGKYNTIPAGTYVYSVGAITAGGSLGQQCTVTLSTTPPGQSASGSNLANGITSGDALQFGNVYQPYVAGTAAGVAQTTCVADVQASATVGAAIGIDPQVSFNTDVSGTLYSVACSFPDFAPVTDTSATKGWGAVGSHPPIQHEPGGAWAGAAASGATATSALEVNPTEFTVIRSTSSSSATVQASQQTLAPSLTFQVEDNSGTGEVVVMYPAWAYDTSTVVTGGTSANGTGVGWSGTASALPNGATLGLTPQSFHRISGFPWSVLTQGVGTPTSHVQNTLVFNGLVNNNVNSVTIAKNPADPVLHGAGNAVDVEAVFSTTPLPPWVCFIMDPQPWITSAGNNPGGDHLGLVAAMDMAITYVQVAALPEFAWYITAIPPITTMDAVNDLSLESGIDARRNGFHPNDHGVLKITQWVCAFLACNVEMMFDGPLPYHRPSTYGTYNGVNYGAAPGWTAGLGARIGFA